MEGARLLMIIIRGSGGRRTTLPRNVITTISPANEQQSPASIHADKYDDDHLQRHMVTGRCQVAGPPLTSWCLYGWVVVIDNCDIRLNVVMVINGCLGYSV